MKKSLASLAIILTCFHASGQTWPFPHDGLNLMPVAGYYTDIGMNLWWDGNSGWKYLENGPSLKLRLGEWNTASDFVFETAPVNNNGIDAPLTFSEVMRIKQNGQVGIGTNTPGNHRLAVEGSIGARRVLVTQGPWADFVFSPSYRLLSLREVESYVLEHRHLPGIPSAGQIAKEGLDLGDMQQKQMQKIEELTLYIIDLNKKLEAQQNVIEQQRAELREIKKMFTSK